MSFVKQGDIYVPEVLLEAIQGQFAGIAVMRATGAAVIATGMPAGRTQVGSQIKVPFFGNMGEMEDLTEDGQALTPRGIGLNLELAEVRHSGIAMEATWWAQASATADPYKEMGRQVTVTKERRIDKALISVAAAPGASAITVDVYNAGTPRTFDYDLMVDAKMAWGDEQTDIACAIMHSKTKADVYKLKDSTGRPLFVDGIDGTIDRFCGVPVIVSDLLLPDTTVSPTRYQTLLLKKASLLFWLGEEHMGNDDDILADTSIGAYHMYWAAHRYGRFPGGTKPGVIRVLHNVSNP